MSNRYYCVITAMKLEKVKKNNKRVVINIKKKYLKLTEDQKKRGVVFSSQLKGSNIIHEVFESDPIGEQRKTIELLLDDKFFNNSRFSYNEIRK